MEQSFGIKKLKLASKTKYSYYILRKIGQMDEKKKNPPPHTRTHAHTHTHTRDRMEHVLCFFSPLQIASKDHSDCPAVQMEQPENC
jgi:hypothetical protein